MFGLRAANDEIKQDKPNNSKKWVKSYIKYSHLPGIIPRFRALGAKFAQFAALLAQIYGAVGLIPRSHPVLNPANVGKFGFRDVLAAASDNLVLSWKNIDQILVFFAIFMGLLTLLVQTVLIVFSVAAGTAFASSGASPASFFTTPNPETDLALIFLEQVFGDINIFSDSSFGAPGSNASNPVFQGLYEMLSFYSMAMMVFAAIIVVYYVITVLAEAAQTGTPFGRRFNSIWAPIRLVVALGLLVPLGNGLNSAQYITLYAAKMGSGLATNAWALFANRITISPDTLVLQAQAPGVSELAKGIYLAEVCRAANNMIEGNLGGSGKVEIVTRVRTPSPAPSGHYYQSVLYSAGEGAIGSLYDTAVGGAASSLVLKWALDNDGSFSTYFGGRDSCGQLSINVASLDFDDFSNGGAITQDNIDIFRKIDRNIAIEIADIIYRIRQLDLHTIPVEAFAPGMSGRTSPQQLEYARANMPRVVTELNKIITDTEGKIQGHIDAGYQELINLPNPIYEEFIRKGWVSAGVWYGQIGKVNETFSSVSSNSAGFSSPVTSASSDSEEGDLERSNFFYNLFSSSQSRAKRAQMAIVMKQVNDNYLTQLVVSSPGRNEEVIPEPESSASGILNTILIAIFQLGELENLRDNASANPLVLMQSAGDTLLTRSLSGLGIFVASVAVKEFKESNFGGFLLSFANRVPFLGTLISGAINIFYVLGPLILAFSLIGLAAAIVLYYILPIIPFMYFFFAVVGWVLEIFEAIVAMPLWALGHLRIDGDGYFGSGALQGYLLIFAILTRPLFIVFGLIGGYVVFTGAVYLLSNTFNEIVDVIGTGNYFGLSSFFYTLLFVYIAYQAAIMCFKMVDSVPNQILRWMGQSVQTFNDNRGDPIGNTTQAVIAAAAIGSQLQNAGTAMRQGLKGRRDAEAASKQSRAQLRAMGADPDDPNLYR